MEDRKAYQHHAHVCNHLEPNQADLSLNRPVPCLLFTCRKKDSPFDRTERTWLSPARHLQACEFSPLWWPLLTCYLLLTF
jgi:hypothetical protein